VDASNVYWVNAAASGANGTVMSAPIGGGIPTTLAVGQSLPGGIAVNATSVYWANAGTSESGSTAGSIGELTPK